MRPMTSLPLPPRQLLDNASLFLDLDGTLVDFATTPDAIEVEESLRELLADLMVRLEGRVAVISGRSLDDLSGHLPVAGLPLAGSHGLERLGADGVRHGSEIPSGFQEARAAAERFAEQEGLHAETKPAGVAIHFRQVPGAEAAVEEFMGELAGQHGLLVQKGSMVRELRPAGNHKGDVVRAFMAEPPFMSGRPVVVGDDFTDEDAFAAALALGGSAILVGDSRATHARYRLPNVAAVLAWLKG